MVAPLENQHVGGIVDHRESKDIGDGLLFKFSSGHVQL